MCGSFLFFNFLSRWLSVGLVHLWTDQRIPGPVSCRCLSGSLETLPRWHATVYWTFQSLSTGRVPRPLRVTLPLAFTLASLWFFLYLPLNTIQHICIKLQYSIIESSTDQLQKKSYKDILSHVFAIVAKFVNMPSRFHLLYSCLKVRQSHLSKNKQILFDRMSLTAKMSGKHFIWNQFTSIQCLEKPICNLLYVLPSTWTKCYYLQLNIYELCHVKRFLKAWVDVIAKEGWVHIDANIILFVWPQLLRIWLCWLHRLQSLKSVSY